MLYLSDMNVEKQRAHEFSEIKAAGNLVKALTQADNHA